MWSDYRGPATALPLGQPEALRPNAVFGPVPHRVRLKRTATRRILAHERPSTIGLNTSTHAQTSIIDSPTGHRAHLVGCHARPVRIANHPTGFQVPILLLLNCPSVASIVTVTSWAEDTKLLSMMSPDLDVRSQ
jgi:hypothetical protein